MPIDPKNLAAFAADSDSSSEEPIDDTLEPEMDEEAEDAPADFYALKGIIAETRDQVEAAIGNVDSDILDDEESEVTEDDIAELQKSFDGLPPRLQEEIQAVVVGASWQELQQVGSALEELSLVDDGEALGGWLFRVGAVLNGEGPTDQEEEEEGDLPSPDDLLSEI